MPTAKLTPEIIAAAIEGFESQKASLDGKIAELRAMLPAGGSAANVTTPASQGQKQRKMSAAGRRAIAEAQRKRWAAMKGEAETHAPEAVKPKRKLSAAGRKAIAATKARWERVRTEAAAKAKKPTTKRAAVKKMAVKTAPSKTGKRPLVKKAA